MNNFNSQQFFEQMESNRRKSQLIGGVFLILIGILTFLDHMNPHLFPDWVFSWQMFLIAIGLFIGFKNSFSSMSSWVLISLGGLFLVNDYTDWKFYEYIVPVFLIGLGFFMIVKQPSKWGKKKMSAFNDLNNNAAASQAAKNELNNDPDLDTSNETNQQESEKKYFEGDDFLSSTSAFGGVEKNILSKNFQGGEINNFFGGAEINLVYADFSNEVTIHVNQAFGGLKLKVPGHWKIKNDIACILGGIEDKRQFLNPLMPISSKTLILKGFCVFGGVEIVSYN
jgi:predicted membrane protein